MTNNVGVSSALIVKSSAKRIPQRFPIHCSRFTFHYPPIGMGTKKSHPLNINQGWDTKYSTVPPWLQLFTATH